MTHKRVREAAVNVNFLMQFVATFFLPWKHGTAELSELIPCAERREKRKVNLQGTRVISEKLQGENFL